MASQKFCLRLNLAYFLELIELHNLSFQLMPKGHGTTELIVIICFYS